jgi:hypothetical protein
MARRQLALAMFAASLACSGDERRGDDGLTSLGDQNDQNDEVDDGSTDADTDTDTGEPKFDFPIDEDIPLFDDGCRKVDFLFVIDSSVSMGDQQVALIASFPSFMATLDEMLPEQTDYRIIVVDTDSVSRCTPETCAAASNAQVIDLCIDDGRGSHACTGMFTACDTVMGAGVVHPSGEGSSNGVCFNDPQRWIEGDDPMRDDKFACAAQLGLAGAGQERPMDAMVAALSVQNNGMGGCNQGFLRDDAVLVVTFISDDPKYEDAGVPMDWYNSVVGSKLGDPEAAVVLGLIPQPPDCQQDMVEISGAHWQEFVQLFGANGLFGSVCSPEYGSFFAQAVGIIATACENYEPPG